MNVTRRTPSDVKRHPLAGDVIEIREKRISDAIEFDGEVMLRVVAVHEDRVWFKEYGKGHMLVHVSKWRERLENASMSRMVRGADHDCPF